MRRLPVPALLAVLALHALLAVLTPLALAAQPSASPAPAAPKSGTDVFTSTAADPGSLPPRPKEPAGTPAPAAAPDPAAPAAPAGPAAPPAPATLSPDRACTITILNPNDPTLILADSTRTGTPQTFGYWTAVGIRPQPGTDWDLALYDHAPGTPCLDGLLATSTYGGSSVDVIVSDFNNWPPETDYQESHLFSGAGSAVLEWDTGADILGVNDFVVVETDSTDVLQIWDVYLDAGRTYEFSISTLGSPEDPLASLMLFENPAAGRYAAGRGFNILETNSSQAPASYTPSRSDWFGLVAVNENGDAGRMEISFGYCETPVALSPGTTVFGGNGHEWYSIAPTQSYWTAVGFRSSSPSRQLSRYGSASGETWPYCFGDGETGLGSYGLPGVMFLLGNFNEIPTKPYYFQSTVELGFGNDVQWDAGADLYLPSAPPVVRTSDANHVIEVWDTPLRAGQTYNLDFETLGAADLELMMFAPFGAGGWYTDTNDIHSTTGSCEPFTAHLSTYWGLAVMNHDGAPGAYQFSLGYAVTDATAPPLDAVHNGRGVSWVDYDVDGDDDLFLTNYTSQDPDKLFRNDGGSAFVDVTPPILAGAASWLFARWADLDNDGDPDVLRDHAYTYGHPVDILRNDGNGVFVDITPALADSMLINDGVWIDFDRDGNLDMALAVSSLSIGAVDLYRGDGAGGFQFATRVVNTVAGIQNSLSWCDYDFDLDPDLYLVTRDGNVLYRNDGNGVFTNVTATAFPPTGPYVSFSAAWGDIDQDLDYDLYVSNDAPATDVLWRNDGGVFTDVSATQLPGAMSSRGCVAWVDVDNDWDLDLQVAPFGTNGHMLLNNRGGGYFEPSANPVYVSISSPEGGLAHGDPDGDGDLDTFVGSNTLFAPDPPHYLRNDLCPGNHWLEVDLQGVASNRSAIGAQATVYTYVAWQRKTVRADAALWSQDSRILHFGTRYAVVDSLVIDWPSGIHQVVTGVPMDQRILVVEDDPALDAPLGPADARPGFALRPGVPNPFRETVSIGFDLPRQAPVSLDVFDVAGRLVRVLVPGTTYPPGRHDVAWDGRNGDGRRVPAGIYFYRLEAGEERATRKVVRLR